MAGSIKETQYVKGTPADRDEIIDFANYVFSQAHVSHDFKILLPKTYDDAAQGIEEWHYLAKQDGRIRALVADRPLKLHVQDSVLYAGCVGTVSVHKYSRGEGLMKYLMRWMLEEEKKKGFDMMILGGQRQRYNYFGFEQAGFVFAYDVSEASLRHTLAGQPEHSVYFHELSEDNAAEFAFARDVCCRQMVYGERPADEFMRIMHNWNSRCRVVYVDGVLTGCVMGDGMEICLTDDGLLPWVLNAMLAESGRQNICVKAAPFERERVELLSKISAGRSIQSVEMINILNWEKVLNTLLKLKASYAKLHDGCVRMKMDGKTYRIRVSENVPSVEETDEKADVELSHMEAQRRLLNMENMCIPDDVFGDWAPLPFNISPADTF